MSISMEVDTSGVDDLLNRLEENLSPSRFEQLMDIMALEAKTILVENTPRKTGITADSWEVEKPAEGERDIVSGSPIIGFLNEGTSDHEITPDQKKALNWDGDKFSKGHTVSGIEPMHIIEHSVDEIQQMMEDICTETIEKITGK